MKDRKLKLAFVGLGGMGQVAHLRNYLLEPSVEVVAAAEIRPALLQKVITRTGIARGYTDHRELLAKEADLDGIVSIQQFTRHASLIPELLSRGVPVLTEKPLARSAEVGEKIFKTSLETKTPLYVGYHKRSDPAVMYAKKLIGEWQASGKFGKFRYLRVSMPPGGWPAPRSGYDTHIQSDEAYPPIVHDAHGTNLNADGVQELDAFVNYYIHQVNLMRHLLGEDYKVTYADPAGVVLGFNSASGISGVLEMAAYQSEIEWQEQAFIAFDKGWIRVDIPGPLTLDAAGKVTVFQDYPENRTAETIIPSLPAVHAMRQQARNFIATLRGQPSPICTAADALKDLQTARDYMDMLWAARGISKKA